MNRPENLERELTAWLADTAAPRVPDFTDDILWQTARLRQRPRWSFPERWLPMSVITLGRRTFKPLPWRTIGLLAVLALLIVAVVAVYVGGQARLPAPFGLARNGLVAYVNGGDIYTVDPITGARQAIVTGPDSDIEPRWSLDGTRLVFIRQAGALGDALVIVDPRHPEKLVSTDVLAELDSDSIAWSPDGRSIAVLAGRQGSRAVFIVDAATGEATPLALKVPPLAVSWRPPDGRQLLVLGGSDTDFDLSLRTLVDGGVARVALGDGSGPIRLSGWTPVGKRLIYQRGEYDQLPIATHVLDVDTGDEVLIDVAYPHVSNDGTRMVALTKEGESMCVVDLRGGPCEPVGLPSQAYNGQHATGVQWSPNDEWIITRPPFSEGGVAHLVDPDGAPVEQPPWLGNGGESWQRLAD